MSRVRRRRLTLTGVFVGALVASAMLAARLTMAMYELIVKINARRYDRNARTPYGRG